MSRGLCRQSLERGFPRRCVAAAGVARRPSGRAPIRRGGRHSSVTTGGKLAAVGWLAGAPLDRAGAGAPAAVAVSAGSGGAGRARGNGGLLAASDRPGAGMERGGRMIGSPNSLDHRVTRVCSATPGSDPRQIMIAHASTGMVTTRIQWPLRVRGRAQPARKPMLHFCRPG